MRRACIRHRASSFLRVLHLYAFALAGHFAPRPPRLRLSISVRRAETLRLTLSPFGTPMRIGKTRSAIARDHLLPAFFKAPHPAILHGALRAAEYDAPW